MSETISFSVPLPPAELRSNSRAHWGRRMKAKVAYSEAVWLAMKAQVGHPSVVAHSPWPLVPWEAAAVTYTWKSCGVQPDKGNIGANVKALQDFLCVAPNTGLQRNDCTYLGIVKDDKHIDPHYELEPVKTRSEQKVHIVIERRR